MTNDNGWMISWAALAVMGAFVTWFLGVPAWWLVPIVVGLACLADRAAMHAEQPGYIHNYDRRRPYNWESRDVKPWLVSRSG